MSSSKIHKWLSEVNTSENHPFEYNSANKSIFCKPCEKAITASQKGQLQQHIKSEKHKSNSSLKRKFVQSQLEFKDAKKPKREEVVGQELCEAFVAANIPLSKVEHPKLRGFLEKNMQITLPSDSTLRKKHMPLAYENCIEIIKKGLEGKSIWISIDETTDSLKRKVANVIIGELKCEDYSKPYLAKCTFLETADSAAIARLANDTLNELWPGFDKQLLKVLISDAAPYMVKAGKDLKIFYPSLIHVTCLCHGLHRVCELVRELYPEVNKLIASIKKVFKKAPDRVTTFKQSYPNLPFPPEPVITR